MPDSIVFLLTNAVGSVYRARRYGRGMRTMRREWKQLEVLSGDDLQKYQSARLVQVVRAAGTTPFYRARFEVAGIDPYKVRTIEDLNGMGYVTRADLQEHWRDMVVPNYRGRTVRRSSSGTTGARVQFLQPRKMAYDETFAMLYQFFSWHGFEPLQRRATLAGRYLGRKPSGVVIRNLLENQLLLGVHSLSAGSVHRYRNAIESFQPKMLQAHPSALSLFKDLSERASIAPPSVPVIAFTAESMPESDRRELREWLSGTMIFGTYGSGENVIAAGECPQLSGYHVHPAVGIAELVGEQGHSEIVATSLLNDAMTLLRYRTGDLTEGLAAGACGCGVTWPRLQSIIGRVDETLTTASGDRIAPVMVRTGISSQGILQYPYTLIQHRDRNLYTLAIYADAGSIDISVFSPVIAYLESLLGAGSSVQVEVRPATEAFSGRGKHRTVIRDVGRH